MDKDNWDYDKNDDFHGKPEVLTKEDESCEVCFAKGSDVGATPCGSILCDHCYEQKEKVKREILS